MLPEDYHHTSKDKEADFLFEGQSLAKQETFDTLTNLPLIARIWVQKQNYQKNKFFHLLSFTIHTSY